MFDVYCETMLVKHIIDSTILFLIKEISWITRAADDVAYCVSLLSATMLLSVQENSVSLLPQWPLLLTSNVTPHILMDVIIIHAEIKINPC